MWSITGSIAVGIGFFSVYFYPLSTMDTWWWTVSGSLWEHKQAIYFTVCLGLAVFCSLFTFGLPLVVYFFSKHFSVETATTPIRCALMWGVLELVRVKILFGLEWAVFGQPLGNSDFFARAAIFGGIFSLSFIAVLINICLFEIFEGIFRKKLNRGPIFIILVLFTALFINNSLFFDANSAEKPENYLKNIIIVSPDLKTTELTEKGGIETVFKAIEEKIENHYGNPGILILPENIFPLIVVDEKSLIPLNYEKNTTVKENFDKLTSLSTQNPKISFVLGLHTTINNQNYNSALVFEAGKISSIYNKEHLLPFTEKNPAFLVKNHVEPLESGVGDQLLTTKYGSFKPFICSEALISNVSFDIWKNKPKNNDILINLSNDNIFESRRVAEYHEIILKIRAIHTQQYIVRSAKGGFSGFFTPTGEIIEYF
jgi:apolipoprotein N-acyltransferase